MNLQSVIGDRRDSTRPALVHDDGVVTYAQLVETTVAVHAGLVELGVQPGDRVAIAAGTTPDFVTCLFGVLRAGAVAVPLNPLAPGPELARELAAVDPTAIFVGPEAAEGVSALNLDIAVVTVDGASVASGEARSLAEFVRSATVEDLPPAECGVDDLAVLLFTSGTAGLPKAAMLSHGNLLANIDQIERHPSPIVQEDDVALGVLPLFHILGLNVLLGTTMHAGGTVVLAKRFDPLATAQLVRDHSVTVVAGPPALWQAWAVTADIDSAWFSSVRVAVSGAAPLTAAIAATVQERLDVKVEQGYGLTESSPALTLASGTGAPATSVGRPLPGVQLRLVDSAGNDVPVGDEGQVWAKGENIFQGYWNDPVTTATVLTDDGWLLTGDVGVVDDDGFLYIVNRTKDLILVSGFNVFPGEVEAVLRSHPDVSDAGVVGVENAAAGELVRAVVVLVAGADLDSDAVITWCRERLAGYKCPAEVVFADELPRGPVGKLRRRELR